MGVFSKLAKHMRFIARKYLFGFDIPLEPYFATPESKLWFTEALASCRYYVEFGSGGSTCLAARLGKPFVTVESDKKFLRAVKDKIVSVGYYNPDRQSFHYADVGFTGPLGKPVYFLKLSGQRKANFRRYSDFPLPPHGSLGLPDLVLIDGRFRVACALKSIQALQDSEGWLIVVDDYGKRESYEVIKKFAHEVRRIGHMAVFQKKSDIDAAELSAAIKRFELDIS